MKAFSLICTVFAVMALVASPVLGGALLSGALGALFVAGSGSPVLSEQVPTAPIVRVVRVEPVRVFELEHGRGVVVFKTVNGKLVSRCYRA